MKKIVVIGFLFAMIVNFVSCSEDDKPTKEESFLSNLSGTWQVDAVMLDGEDVTEEFGGMSITFKKDQTFTVQNPVGNIWDGSGMFTLAEGTSDLFDLLRDDDVMVSINSLSENTLVFSMQFDSAPGKLVGLAGEYTFEMER